MGDRITSLPADVRSLLRTGVAITHVTQCVEELIVNALDAGATCVAVRVDLPCFKVQVVDNGRGVRLDDLNFIGERYATSKCHEVSDLDNLCYYGYRGEALASIRDITSILEINSRSQHGTQTYCKIFQHGKSLPVTDSVIPRSSSGTTVTVYDLFYNLPVRKKCCNPVLDLEKIRQKIEGIALIKPLVSFSLRNDVSGNVILQTHKTNSILNTFTYLFGPAKSKSLTEVTGKEGHFSVNGYIGKKGCNKKDYQFIYINGRQVLKTKLHKTVNHHLSKSLILRKKLELTTNKFRGHIMTTSPTKTIDQYAIFVLNITCPYQEYDITFEPAKTLVEFKDLDLLQHCLEKTITEFLKRESLHLGILSENFGKKNNENNNEAENALIHATEEFGLRLKPEIKTTDRNGLFSKIVKRKIPLDSINCEESFESQSSDDFGNMNENITDSDVNMPPNENLNSLEEQEDYLQSLGDFQTPQYSSTSNCPGKYVPTSPVFQTNMDEKSISLSNSHDNIVGKIEGGEIDKNIHLIRRRSISEGEFSEDPFPTEKRSQPSSGKKNIICIDTPVVREAKISISRLSKLRKRKTNEDPRALADNVNKQEKYTQLKNKTDSNSVKLQKRAIDFPKNIVETSENVDNFPNLSTSSKSPGPVITSSLQRLRKFRSKDLASHTVTESANWNTFKQSLQELRRHRTLVPESKLKTDVILQKLNLQEISKNKEKMEEVVQFKECSQEALFSDVEKSVASQKDDGNKCGVLVGSDTLFNEKLHQRFSDSLKGDMSMTKDTSFPSYLGVNITSDRQSVTDCHRMSSDLTNNSQKSRPALVYGGEHSNDYTLSSPIDIEEACKSIENCVTEIENIISRRENEQKSSLNTKSTDTFLKTVTAKEEEIAKSFVTSDHMIQTAQTYLGRNNNDNSEMQITWHDRSPQLNVNLSNPRYSEDYTDTCHKNLTTVRDHTESGFLDQDMSFMSYFDDDSSRIVHSNDEKSKNTLNYKTKLPFEIYMKHMAKRVKIATDYETDQFLLCHESMHDIDETQPFIQQTEEFSLADDSGIVKENSEIELSDLEENEINVEFQDNVPVFKTMSPISPCLSEGFSPEIDMENDNEVRTEKISDKHESSLNDCFNIDENECIETNNTSSLHDSSCIMPRNSSNEINAKSCSYCKNPIQYQCLQKRVDVVSDLIENDFGKHAENLSDGSFYNTDLVSISAVATYYHSNTTNSSQSNSYNADNRYLPLDSTTNPNSCSGNGSQIVGENLVETEVDVKTSEVQLNQSVSLVTFPVIHQEIFSPNGDQELIDIKATEDSSPVSSPENRDESQSLFSPDGDCKLRDVQYEFKTWIEMADPKSGNKLYVNTRSGHSVSASEWIPPEDDIEQHTEACPAPVCKQNKIGDLSPESSMCLRNMMNEHLSKEDDDLRSVKWKHTTQVENDNRKVEDLFEEWENPVFTMAPKTMPSIQVSHISRASSKTYQALNPCVFDKEMLDKFKVLGQVDNKFIACSLQTSGTSQRDELLVLIDQHAAHERIRLEDLTKDAYEVVDDVKMISHTELTSELSMTLPEEVVRVMASFVEEFKIIGLRFSVDKSQRDGVTLHTVPSCIIQKEDGKKKKDTAVMKTAQNLIKEYVEVLQDTRGSRGRLPNTLHKILCSQACHGAIKFGDPLTLTECEDLLRSLSKCKLPFQCAHGRPSVVPLIQLGDRHQERRRPNLWKIARQLQHKQS